MPEFRFVLSSKQSFIFDVEATDAEAAKVRAEEEGRYRFRSSSFVVEEVTPLLADKVEKIEKKASPAKKKATPKKKSIFKKKK